MLDVYAQFFKAATISLTLGFAGIFCAHNDEPELAIGLGLNSVLVYAAAVTSNKSRAATGDISKKKRNVKSIVSRTLSTKLLSAKKASIAKKLTAAYPTVYVKNKFFALTTVTTWEKDAYLWLLLKLIPSSILTCSPVGLTYDDRMKGINLLWRQGISPQRKRPRL
jgi:hypothetical protein